ncbi:MAG: methyl-accepting chemotaxis protein [Granulosicoccus sp.]|jgi:methyl-accepting chemotaxis protein
MSIRFKLIILVSLCSLVPLLAVSGLSGWKSSQLSSAALNKKAEDQLTMLRELKKEQLTNYFDTLISQTKAMSQNTATIDALDAFAQMFSQYKKGKDISDEAKNELTAFYENDFRNELKARNGDDGFSAASLISGLPDTTLKIQHAYVAHKDHPIGQKQNVDWVKDRTNYSRMHKEAHPGLREFVANTGVSDLFLIDRIDKNVVYSTKKNIDFGTSLVDGVFARTALAEAGLAALEMQEGEYYISDMKPYIPMFNEPVMFIATPMFSWDENIGSLVIQITTEDLESIMTSNQRWSEIGLGVTGETYLVGQDKRLRTNLREAIANPDTYFSTLVSDDKQTEADLVKQRKNGINYYVVDTPSVEAALNGELGFVDSINSRGKRVLSAYTTLDLGKHRWALVSEIEAEEVFSESAALTKKIVQYIVLGISIAAVIVIAVSLYAAKMVVQPLEAVVSNLNQLAQGDGDLTIKLSSVDRNDEIGELSRSFNIFIEFMRNLIEQIQGATDEFTHASHLITDLSMRTRSMSSEQKVHIQEVHNAIQTLNERIVAVGDDIVVSEQKTELAKQQVTHGAEVAQSSISSIEHTNQAVTQTENHMNGLLEEVRSISSVLEVINSIAEQTNLLALNAAIEAARAGEQGRGFAVVADEVRTLAGKTQQSTIEIATTIKRLGDVASKTSDSMREVQEHTGKTREQITTSSEDMSGVTDIIGEVSEFSRSISQSSQEQTRLVEGINESIDGIDQSGKTIEESASELNQAIEKLNKMSSRIDQMVSQFKVAV